MAASVNSDRFLPNTHVTIDGKGKAKVIKVTESANGHLYTVKLDGIDFEAELPGHRLSSFIDVENRFVHMNNEEIDAFVTGQKKNTLSKTFYDNQLLKKFMDTPEVHETRQIHDIPPQELCPLLCKFFVGVRKSDGSQYEPNSLRGFICSFERHCEPDNPVYIATNTKKILGPCDQPFKKQPIGVNKLTSLMSRMATATGLPPNKKLSNHSAHKHLVQKLSEHNVPPTHIMQITGHKNVQSINNYSHINELQHRQISNILSNSSRPDSLITPSYYNPERAPLTFPQYNTAHFNSQTEIVKDSLTSTFSNISGGSKCHV